MTKDARLIISNTRDFAYLHIKCFNKILKNSVNDSYQQRWARDVAQ